MSTADMFSVAPDIVAAFAAGDLSVRVREARLVDVEHQWSEKTTAGERLVFTMA